MTLAQLQRRVESGVQRDDLDYAALINDALREIMQRRSWNAMRQVDEVVILKGNTSVALPGDFKEFTNTRPPVHQKSDAGTLLECDVWTREKVIRRNQHTVLKPLTGLQVYLDWQDGVPTLNLNDAPSEDVTFVISYFAYLPPLSDDADQNLLTRDYAEMVIAKAKALAFEAVNDPIAVDFESLFETKFKSARATDSYAAVAGTELRM